MLKIENLSFGYSKNNLVLRQLRMELKKGELLAIMGPSGCGKSTLLRLIGGFLSPSSGTLQINAKKISYAFQEPRLFPWLSVEENLQAVLTKNANASDIQDALRFVELEYAAELYPDELSGGMQSRVSLARALLYGGDLFLLDEPFSALDQELAKTLAIGLREKLKEMGASAILVTHQAEVAELFADQILRMDQAVNLTN